MARGGKVTISGLKELDWALAELPKATARSILRKTLLEAGEPIAAAARSNAPKDVGELAESIDVSTKLARSQRGKTKLTNGRADPKNFVEAYVGPGQHPQAITQEFGTYKEPAQPYMRPAWDEKRGETLDLIVNTLGPRIEDAARRLGRR